MNSFISILRPRSIMRAQSRKRQTKTPGWKRCKDARRTFDRLAVLRGARTPDARPGPQLCLPMSSPFSCRFPSAGLCGAFLDELHRNHLTAEALTHNMPHCIAAIRELGVKLRQHRIDLLCCHGYKPNLLGRPAARRIGIPAFPYCAAGRGQPGKSGSTKRSTVSICATWIASSASLKGRQEGPPRRDAAAGPRHSQCDLRRPLRRSRRAGPGVLAGVFCPATLALDRRGGPAYPEKGFGDLVMAAAAVVRAVSAGRLPSLWRRAVAIDTCPADSQPAIGR